MANMSYCRFENTSKDLQDCVQAIEDGEIDGNATKHELEGLERLLYYAKHIVEMEDEINEVVDNHLYNRHY